jgi:phosphoribosylanthranilate isomerase
MTEVKICGLTREEDVVAACELGAAILGFNFVPSSPRRISTARARAIGAVAPPKTLRAGVFADAGREEIALAIDQAGLQIVQLHRRVTAEDVEALSARVVPAVRMEAGRGGLPPEGVLVRCRSVLWDSSGGRGLAADWDMVDRAGPLPVPVYVAGGLDPDNVGDVIRRLRPAGVDVASGVENAPGMKDRRKLERFFEAVREADGG